MLGVGDGPAPHGWHFRWWGHQSRRAGCGQPCRVCPDPTSTPSFLGRGWLLKLGGRYTWHSPGDILLGNDSHLPCLPPPGSYDWECLSEVLGSSILVTAVTVPPPGLPYLPLNPAPLARARMGRGKREDDNKVPGVPSTKGKGIERFFFFPTNSLPNSQCLIFETYHLLREKDWGLNRSQNNADVCSRGTYPGTQGLIYRICR